MKASYYILGILFFLFSCKKEININRNDANPDLPVFTGWVNNLGGIQKITVSATSDFSSPNSSDYLSGAQIKWSNSNGVKYFSASGNQYNSPSNFVLSQGKNTLEITLNGEIYTQEVEVFDPIDIQNIAYYEGNEFDHGLLVQFDLPTEDNFAMVFELLVDSTGVGNQYKSLTPTIHEMELFENYLSEFNQYGDVIIFKDLLDPSNTSNIYKLILHRISVDQYNYLLRIQQEPDGGLYSTLPVNMPTMFTNNGLGIVIASSDSYIQFYF